MRKLITKEFASQIQFYQMPKGFFHNPKYMSLRSESKLAYMLMLDLVPLSIQNNWVNENNEVFVKLSRTKLMNLLNIRGTQKAAQVIKELVDYQLIVYKRVGLNKCNEIYLYPLEEGPGPKDPALKAQAPKIQSAAGGKPVAQLAKPVAGPTHCSQDFAKDMDDVQDLLENQIHIDELKQRYNDNLVDEIANNISDMYLNTSTRIGQQNKPMIIVRSIVKKLKMHHIEHVLDRYLEITKTTEIINTKRYLQTMIYNSIYEASAKIMGHIKYNTTLTW